MAEDTVGFLPEQTAEFLAKTGRPLVTVSYAQSLDGCLTLRRGESSPVSGDAAMRMTHELRAAHDAIAVGIETVLADDPQMTVRLVDGSNPQPVVLDSSLRFPLNARLIAHPRGVWIATTHASGSTRRKSLEDAGARVLMLPESVDGLVDLDALLVQLGQAGIESLMVEGGALVISSFLRQGLADRAVITIAPVFAAGYHAVHDLNADDWRDLPRLTNPQVLQAGEDLIVWGDLM